MVFIKFSWFVVVYVYMYLKSVIIFEYVDIKNEYGYILLILCLLVGFSGRNKN